MLATPSFNVGFKKFFCLLTMAILLTSCRFAPAPPPAPTTWTITVDVTSPSSIAYQVAYTPSTGGCKYAGSSVNSNPKVLHVCPNDFLQWQCVSTAKSSEMVVFTSDGILSIPGPGSFAASDDQVTTPPAQVTSNPDSSSTPPHEWYLAAYDKHVGGKIRHDDPKIIIGQ